MHATQHQGMVCVILGLFPQWPTPLQQLNCCLPATDLTMIFHTVDIKLANGYMVLMLPAFFFDAFSKPVEWRTGTAQRMRRLCLFQDEELVVQVLTWTLNTRLVLTVA